VLLPYCLGLETKLNLVLFCSKGALDYVLGSAPFVQVLKPHDPPPPLHACDLSNSAYFLRLISPYRFSVCLCTLQKGDVKKGMGSRLRR